MTPDTEYLLWRRFNEWFRARRPDYPSEWDAYQAGYATAKAETAAAVAKERERAAIIVDAKIGSVRKANLGRGGRVNSTAAFALSALRDCEDAIRAGAKEPSDG